MIALVEYFGDHMKHVQSIYIILPLHHHIHNLTKNWEDLLYDFVQWFTLLLNSRLIPRSQSNQAQETCVNGLVIVLLQIMDYLVE